MNTSRSSVKIFCEIVLILIIFTSTLSNGANILFFFIGGNYSHKLSVWPHVCALAARGHNVTFFSKYTRQPESHAPCGNVTDLTSVSIDAYNAEQGSFSPLEIRQAGTSDEIWAGGFQVALDLCQIILRKAKSEEDPVLRYLVYEGDFDLIINNAILSDCGYILAHHYNSKLIISSSTVVLPWYQELFGISSDASWVPDWSVKLSSYPMNFLDRLRSFYLPLYYHFFRIWSFYPQLEKLAMEAYNLNQSTVPSVMEIEKSASLVLVQTHVTTGLPRSTPPNFIEVGGMQCWQPKGKSVENPLLRPGSPLQKFLDSAQEGAVLIAFGSIVDFSSEFKSPMTLRFKSLLLEMMAKFPKIKFVLGGEIKIEEGARPKNLFTAKWLPQSEILSHPNVKAFLTHGGLNSVTEATYYGVPLIVLPLFVDQDYNAYRIQSQRIGITVEFQDVTLEMLVNAVHGILSDPTFSRNMKTWSKVFKDRPMNPIETAVYWTEFVLRNEDFSMMKPINFQLNWFQKHLLDVYLLTFLASATALVLVAFLVSKVIGCIHHLPYDKIKAKIN